MPNTGEILVSGYFAYSNRFGIVRLTSTGVLDDTFNSGVGCNFSGTTNAIALQADGKIVVGGEFTSYNDISVLYLMRINGSTSNITAPKISSITSASRCGEGIVTLSAIASDGILDWYSTAADNVSLGQVHHLQCQLFLPLQSIT